MPDFTVGATEKMKVSCYNSAKTGNVDLNLMPATLGDMDNKILLRIPHMSASSPVTVESMFSECKRSNQGWIGLDLLFKLSFVRPLAGPLSLPQP